MSKTTVCLLVLLCSLAAHGQKQPQWRVVKSVSLLDQTEPISDTTWFTPPTFGVYRLSGYMAGTNLQSGTALEFIISWTDVSGTTGGSSIVLSNQLPSGTINPTVFSVRSGTPVVYHVQATPPPVGYTYILVLTVEKLQND
jgi:hypothetical protein